MSDRLKISILATALGALLMLAASLASAHQLPAKFTGFEDPATCEPCHKAIYDEWKGSMHANSSKLSDPVHGAVHEAFVKAMKAKGAQAGYFCGSCHMPTADNLSALMKGEAAPDAANPTNARGVTCSFCHKVDSLVEGERFNTYKVTEGIKGATEKSAAPHGEVRSEFVSSYQMCLGCHGALMNGKGSVVCSMQEEGISDCLACHMKDVPGAPAEGSSRTTHRAHLLPGGHDEATLKAGAKVELGVELGRLIVNLKNPNPHYFPSTNPMRVAYVKVEVFDAAGGLLYTNFVKDPSEDPKGMLVKLFKAGDKMGVPSWDAEGVGKDTRLAPNESRAIVYQLPERAAKAKVGLYYRFVPAMAIEKFNIPADGVVEKPRLVSEAEIAI